MPVIRGLNINHLETKPLCPDLVSKVLCDDLF
jgi:hypothetical protein